LSTVLPCVWWVFCRDFCHWGQRFDFVRYDEQAGSVSQSIEALDKEGMSIIEHQDGERACMPLTDCAYTSCTHTHTHTHDMVMPSRHVLAGVVCLAAHTPCAAAGCAAAGFGAYIDATRNTICGRHPISVLLHAMHFAKTRFRTRFTHYAQVGSSSSAIDCLASSVMPSASSDILTPSSMLALPQGSKTPAYRLLIEHSSGDRLRWVVVATCEAAGW
jgi:hypothetical protein